MAGRLQYSKRMRMYLLSRRKKKTAAPFDQIDRAGRRGDITRVSSNELTNASIDAPQAAVSDLLAHIPMNTIAPSLLFWANIQQHFVLISLHLTKEVADDIRDHFSSLCFTLMLKDDEIKGEIHTFLSQLLGVARSLEPQLHAICLQDNISIPAITKKNVGQLEILYKTLDQTQIKGPLFVEC